MMFYEKAGIWLKANYKNDGALQAYEKVIYLIKNKWENNHYIAQILIKILREFYRI